MNKLVSGAIGVEIKISDTTTKFYLPDVISLRGKRIKHIDFCKNTDVTTAPSGRAITNIDSNLFLTIREMNTQNELIQNLPIVDLCISGNRLFINKIIDFQQSYISVVGPIDPVRVIDKSIYLIVWYDEPMVWNTVNSIPRNIIEPLEIKLTGFKTYFKENLKLKNKKIENILLSFPIYSPSGDQGIEIDYIGNKFITLCRNNFEFFQQVPLYVFYQLNLYYELRLQNIQFDLQKSYIESGTNTVNDMKTVFFNLIIDDLQTPDNRHDQKYR